MDLSIIGGLDYLDYMRALFSVCENKAVIELGPFNGWHSTLIMECNPTEITLVEANPDVIEHLTQLLAPINSTIVS